ncbi:hypothetical protein Vafri_9437, partial [Volvox africanus]
VWDERTALAATAAVINGALSQYVRTMSLNPPPPHSTEQRLPLPHWQYQPTLPFLSLPALPPSLPPAAATSTATATTPIVPPAPPHQHQHQHQNPLHVAVTPTPTPTPLDTATTSNPLGWRPAIAPLQPDVYDVTAANCVGFPPASEPHRILPQWISSAPVMAAGLSFPYAFPSFPYCDMSLQPALVTAAATASTGAVAAQQAQLVTDICGGCYGIERVAPAIATSSAATAAATAAAAAAHNMQADGADTSADQQPVLPPLEYGGPLPLQRLGASRLHELLQLQQQRVWQQQQQLENYSHHDQHDHQRGAAWLRPRVAEGVG